MEKHFLSIPFVNFCMVVNSSYYLSDSGWFFYVPDQNECLNFPCENDGTCTNTLGSYLCKCSKGWTGPRCRIGNITQKVSLSITAETKWSNCKTWKW